MSFLSAKRGELQHLPCRLDHCHRGPLSPGRPWSGVPLSSACTLLRLLEGTSLPSKEGCDEEGCVTFVRRGAPFINGITGREEDGRLEGGTLDKGTRGRGG